jgi:23S rRNA (cytosine1962-C5)-methyltransferase
VDGDDVERRRYAPAVVGGEASLVKEAAKVPPAVTVKAGHVQPLWAGHPWVFRQALERVDEGIGPGDEVLVIDPHGKILGRGLYSPKSAIAVRVFSREGGRAVDGELITARIEHAVKLRHASSLPDATPGRETSGYRLVHGEGDGLPGLIVDVYDDVLAVQFGTLGLRRLEALVVEALVGVLAPKAVIDRTPKTVAQQEGFEATEGPRVLHGEAPEVLRFKERGLTFELPLPLGQKTGFYFDQRPLRERIEALSRGARVLDAYSYVGAIGMAAARGGAREVWSIDRSEPAVLVAQHCAGLNGVGEVMRFDVGDAASALRSAADRGGYDVVVCDPPKLAPSRRSRQNAAGGYRKLAAAAAAATSVGGVLAFCSCSASIDMGALARLLALGARDAGRRAVIFDRCFQGPDHPVVAAFPEGLYLKVLLARVELA